MGRKFAKASLGLLFFLNIAFVILFLAACYSSQVDPGIWWVAGFLPLLIPYLLAAVLFFAIMWIFIRPRRSLLSLLATFLASGPILTVIPMRLPKDFQMNKTPGSIRVMTWNVRFFAPFKIKYKNSEKLAHQDSVRLEVERFMPDVLCFQEFVNIPLEEGKEVLGEFKEKLGFTHHYFVGERENIRKYKTGMAILSKYPIMRTTLVDYPDDLDQTGEKSVMADILIGSDTIRFYSIHLQSFGFMPRDYWTFRRIRNRNDSGLVSAKSLLTKMKQTFQFHSREARYIASVFAGGPRLKVICGDLNDVPSSYAYKVVRADRKDAHSERGSGFGKTYTSPSSRTMGKLPSLRIDHIFTDPVFEILQTTRGKALLSDHQAVVADIRLPQMR